MKESWFLSCGAGLNQAPLARAAKLLGYRVAACDSRTESPLLALGLLDQLFPRSLLDASGIQKDIQESRELRTGLRGIYARSYGRAVEIAHFLSRRTGLISNPHKSLRFFRDKARYKKTLGGWDIPVPEAQPGFSGPWIVRPKSGHAKEGIRILQAGEMLQSIPSGSFAEPLMNGRECILLGMVVDGTFYPVVITDRFKNPDFTDRMHVFPSILPPFTKYQAVEHCRRIVRRTGLKNGPFLAEFIVDAEDRPFLVECAPEVGGEFLADDLVPVVTGLPYFEILVRVYTGLQIEAVHGMLRESLEQTRQTAMVIRYLPPVNTLGSTDASVFPKALYMDQGFYFARELDGSGAATADRRNGQRPGVFALTGPVADRNDLMERADGFASLMSGIELA